MKKLFALMLALMLALAGMSMAGAEDAAAAETEAIPVTASTGGSITLTANLNSDTLAALTGAADENAAKVPAAIAELVNGLSITMTSDGVDAEMYINLNNTPVAGLAVLKDTDTMLLVSDLIPNYILKLDQAAMGSMMPQVSTAGGSMPQISLDAEQMTALMAPLTQLLNDMMAKVGEPEAVEATFFDTAFTMKAPINLTTKEALLMLLGAAKEIVSQEAFASVLEQAKGYGMSVEINAETIDQEIEKLNGKTDDELAVLDAASYSNESGDGIFVVNVTDKDQTVSVVTGSIGGGFVSEVNVPGSVYLIMKANQPDGGFTMNVQFAPQEGMNVNLDIAFNGTEEGFAGTVDVKMNDAELGTLTITGTPNGVLSGAFTLEGKTEISIADLQDSTNENAKAFTTEVQTGLMTLLSKIMTAVPSFSVLMTQMMPTPQTTTAD